MAHKKAGGSSRNGRDSRRQAARRQALRRREGPGGQHPRPPARHQDERRRECRRRPRPHAVRHRRRQRVSSARAGRQGRGERAPGAGRSPPNSRSRPIGLRRGNGSPFPLFVFGPQPMKFLDQAKIYLRSGNGGAGCVGLPPREVHRVRRPGRRRRRQAAATSIVECVDGLNTLIDYRYAQHFRAENGHHGSGSQRTGGAGKDVVLQPAARHPDLRRGQRDPAGRPRPRSASGSCCSRAATAASATCTTRPRPTARRAAPTRAGRARSAGSGCG